MLPINIKNKLLGHKSYLKDFSLISPTINDTIPSEQRWSKSCSYDVGNAPNTPKRFVNSPEEDLFKETANHKVAGIKGARSDRPPLDTPRRSVNHEEHVLVRYVDSLHLRWDNYSSSNSLRSPTSLCKVTNGLQDKCLDKCLVKTEPNSLQSYSNLEVWYVEALHISTT